MNVVFPTGCQHGEGGEVAEASLDVSDERQGVFRGRIPVAAHEPRHLPAVLLVGRAWQFGPGLRVRGSERGRVHFEWNRKARLIDAVVDRHEECWPDEIDDFELNRAGLAQWVAHDLH